ncbi:MAG: DNA polymerase/3'-5' exonuclease PolX [Verrucomicrobia bacterium]|nr:DNA polymerase/3'-5' exonuclease PolX [Verrucomicrobiota bacterium]
MSETPAHVGEILEHIAQLLELKGENPFKIRAYTNAARALESLSEPIETIVNEGRLGSIEGIGKAITEKVTELVTTGKLEYYEELKGSFPEGIFELFELQGLGAKKIRALHEQLGVSSVADLERVCKEGKVAELAGFGEKTQTKLLKAIDDHSKHAGRFRINVVAVLAEQLLSDLRAHEAVGQISEAGSFRRRKETIGDLDILVSSKNPEEVTAFFVHHPLVEEVIVSGPTKSSVRLKDGVQCDLRAVKPEEFPFALVYFTGSKEHNIRLRSRALERGWSLNEYRFTLTGEGDGAVQPPEIHDEKELYKSLGLDFIPPELREDKGEIAAAESGKLPELIEWSNLRGTFHCHTTASDGKNSLLEMARAAIDLGLEYLGIADHSKSSFQARGLDAARLAEQVAEIRELNESEEFREAGFRLFAGTECDILKEGDLDFPDEVLATLDYVVASVHSGFTADEKTMTERIIRAIRNPYVTMLGHATGRLLLSREAYALNLPAIIEAAAETGTIVEINASPWRLDMDWRWWPLAKEKGVKCAINPDAHTTYGLHDLHYGVGIARKGWLTKVDVVNCLPLGKIEQVLAAKRFR